MNGALTPELEALLQGYVEGSLAPEEALALLAEMKAHPALATEILRALQMDQFIRDTVKLQKVGELLPESRNANASTFKSGTYEHVATVNPRRSRTSLWIAASAAAIVMLGMLLYRGLFMKSEQPIGELRSATHTTVEHRGKRSDAAAGEPVFDGDSINTSADGAATLVYPDGTRTVFAPGSVAQIGGVPSAPAIAAGKRVLLTSGELSASVTPQPAESPFVFFTPQAQAVVVGTELKLAVRESSTRLDVTKGKVRITNVESRKSVDVSGGEFAVAAATIELAAAPQTAVASRNFPSGIVGAWLLGTGPGAMLDDSGHNNHGVAFGNPQTREEQAGKALELDGESRFVELEKHGAYDDLQRGTVMAWIRCDAPRREGRQMTIFGAQNGAGEMFEFAVKNEQLIVWAGRMIGQNHEWSDVLSGAAALPNREAWHHVAYVVSDRGNALYIDGARTPTSFSVGSAERPFFFAHALTSQDKNTRYRIGASVDTLEECFHGAMRDVQLFDRALTDSELRTAAQSH